MDYFRCERCPMRAKYEQAPRSLAGRFWRWHINFCPGWKAYFTSLSPEQQTPIRERYKFTKYTSR